MLKSALCGMANEAGCPRYQYHYLKCAWRCTGNNLDKWVDDAFQVIITSEILDEYLQVLNRPKFRIKQATIDKITRYIYLFAEFVAPEERIHFIEADPKDDKFLDAAVAGHAEYIVSGDKHLLELKEFRQIPILTAREFLDQLEIT